MDEQGITVECSGCSCSMLLPYSDESKVSVLIAPIKGWTAPPVRCPVCTREGTDG